MKKILNIAAAHLLTNLRADAQELAALLRPTDSEGRLATAAALARAAAFITSAITALMMMAAGQDGNWQQLIPACTVSITLWVMEKTLRDAQWHAAMKRTLLYRASWNEWAQRMAVTDLR